MDTHWQSIRKTVKNSVSQRKMLADVKKDVLKSLGILYMKSVDENYVDYKFFKYCRENWENEINTFFQSKTTENIGQLIKEIISVHELKNICPPFCNSSYFTLIVIESRLLTDDDQYTILQKFKLKVAQYVVDAFKMAFRSQDICMQFIDCLSDFVYDWKSQYSTNNQPNFNWIGLTTESISFEIFLKNIVEFDNDDATPNWKSFCKSHPDQGSEISKLSADKFMKLKQNASDLLMRAILHDSLKENTISLYNVFSQAKTISVVKKNLSKNVLQIKQNKMILSHCNDDIIERLDDSIDEIHIFAFNTLFINQDFTAEVFKGKNIVVLSKNVVVVRPVTWNVSGKEGTNACTTPNNGCNGLDGMDGADGDCGESGGNVSLISDNYQHLELLKVISNGGNGGNGQPGGNGKNGIDGLKGHEISLSTLKNNFPSPAVFAGHSRSPNLRKTIVALNSEILTSLKSWSKNINETSGDLLTGFLINEFGIYLKGTTREGCTIEFSFYEKFGLGGIYRQCYLLYEGAKGSSGTPGGPGGLGGLGGEGGFPGNAAAYFLDGRLSTFQPNKETLAGSKGTSAKNGNRGSRGKPGSNGLDVGYTDRYLWSDAVYFGPGTFETIRFDEDEENTAWCSYYDKYTKFKSIRKPQSIDLTLDTEATKERTKAETTATRKDAINVNQVVQNYSSESQVNQFKMSSPDLQQWISNNVESSRNILEKQSNVKAQKRKTKICKPAPTKLIKKRRYMKYVTERPRNTTPSNKKNRFTAAKYELLEKVRKQLQLEWDNWPSMKPIYVKRATCNDTNSAFHAIFGELNQMGHYEAESRKRKEFCEKLKKVLPFTDERGKSFLQESLKAFFEDKFKIKESYKIEVPLTKKLDKYRDNYENDKENFGWNDLLKDKSALSEYPDFLCHPAVPFLISDVNMLGVVYALPIQIYYYHSSSKSGLISMELETSMALVDHRIAVDERNNFSKVIPVMTRDMKNVHQRMNNIINEVEDLDAEEEFKQYLSKVHLAGLNENDQDEDGNGDIHLKYDLVNRISKYIDDDDNKGKTLLEASLLGFPVHYLHIIWERLDIGQIFWNSNAFEMLCAGISEASFQDENTLIYKWIIATFPVDEWIKQFFLLNLEQKFDGVHSTDVVSWRNSISTLPNQLIIFLLDNLNKSSTMNKSELTVYLGTLAKFDIKETWNLQQLEEIILSQWPSHFKKLILSENLKDLSIHWNSDGKQFGQSLYYLHALQNEKPKHVKRLLEIIKLKLKKLKQKVGCDVIIDLFSNIYGGKYHLDEEVLEKLQKESNTAKWMECFQSEESETQLRSLEAIEKIIFQDENSTLSIKKLKEIFSLVREVKTVKVPTLTKENFTERMRMWKLEFDSMSGVESVMDMAWKKFYSANNNCGKATHNQIKQALAMIDQVINFECGFRLRDTQKTAIVAAVMMAFGDNSDETKNILAQVATGEGKSLIVLSVAIITGLLGQTTDIITSSSVLAQRDATDNKNIYEAFGITVGDNTNENETTRANVYAKTVVYGEVSSFQRDFLLDRFYNENIRGSRKFQNIIVDEVDSMFLDKGNSVLYLSHQPPGLDTLEGLFIHIWNSVVQSLSLQNFSPNAIHESVLEIMYPTLTPKDILLMVEVAQLNDLWDWLHAKDIIAKNGRISVDKDFEEILKKLPEKFKQIERQLTFALKKRLTRPSSFKVMNYLKPFVERHLLTWIANAYQATQLVDGREYIVDVDHTKTKLDRNPRIMILDLNTGTDLRDSQWSEGLHQFLQIKHGCKMTMMSLKAVFISNVSFFKKYKRIFGLTGTIGTDVDRDFLRTTYSVELISIPLALPKQFIEEEPKITKSKIEWKKAIFDDAMDKTTADRSVLIICQTVNDAEELYQHFAEMKNPKLTDCIELYRRDYERFQATADGKYLEGGKVLIATNLAGRGTDIKVSNNLNASGGLHVCLSYLPDNLRVEQQAFGRCARKGNAGSGRLIFFDENACHDNSSVEAIDLKIERDEAEFLRVSNIKDFYEKVVHKEELMFAKFQESFRTVNESLAKAYTNIKDHKEQKKVAGEENENQIALVDGNVNEIKELVMYSMLDDWAFWVDEYEINITATDDRRRKIEENENSFGEIVRKYKSVSDEYNDANWMKRMVVEVQKMAGYVAVEETALNLIREPALLVKVGKCFINRKNYGLAKKYFDMVIENEPDFCTAALYYKTLTLLNDQQYTKPEFAELFDNTMKNVDEEIQRQSSFAALAIETNKIVGGQTVICTEAYRQQKENNIGILNLFKTSLETLCGKRGISPEVLLSICNEDVAGKLYEVLLKDNAIEEVKVTNSIITAQKIRKVAEEFSIKDDVLVKSLSDFRGKYLTKSNIKALKKKFDLPSREEFWKQIKNCFVDEKCFAVIKCETVTNEEVKNAEAQNKPSNDFKLWKRDPEKPFLSKYGTDMTNNRVIEGNKKEMKKEQKFINWRKNGRLCYENVAAPNLKALKTLALTKYHRVEKQSFTIIDGIDDVKSGKIFDILVQCKIIKSDGILVTTEWQQLKAILTKLPEFSVYFDDITSILYHKCCYQYELLSLIHTLEKADVTSFESRSSDTPIPLDQQITVGLPIRPHNDLILSLMDINAVENSKINWKYFEESFVKSILSGAVHQPLVWAKWFGKKTGLISQQNAYLTSDDIQKLFHEAAPIVILSLIDELNERKWLENSGKIIWTEKSLALSSIYEHYERDLRGLVQLKIKLTEENFLKEVLEILKNLGGKLKTLDSPHGYMISLEDQFQGRDDRYDYLDELSVFHISGFDHVIDTVEKQYTWKMILSTIAVICIGICQIIIGTIIQFKTLAAGTFLASALIQEGFSDILYGMQCFYHGHFSWKDYANHKWTSMAITAATMGIGGLLAKGVKYNKYGFKLFGPEWMNKGADAVLKAAKNTGKGGVNISIFKTLAKSAGYKILQGCAFGAANIAISYAYDKGIKRVVESVSTEILTNATEALNSDRLSTQLEALVDKCGVTKAQEILDRSSREAFNKLSYKEDMTRYMQTILGVIIGGVGAACAKFHQAGDFSKSETAIVFTLLAAYNYALKTIQVLEALTNIRLEADAYLKTISAELAMEMNNVTISQQFQKPLRNDILAFQTKFKEDTKNMLREKTGSIMQTAIIEPLLRAGCQKLLTSLGKSIRGEYRRRNEERYSRQAEEISEKMKDPDLDKEERLESHKKLLQLACKSRNPDVVAHIVSKGGALGIEAVQALANKLNVTITIESDNGDLPKVINPDNNKGGPIGTLNLKHTVDSDGNFGHWESKSASNSSPTGGFSPDCLLDAVNNELREQKIDAEPVSRSNLADHMKTDPSFRNFISNGWHNSYNSIGGFGGRADERCFDKLQITDKIDEKAQRKLLSDYEKQMEQTGELKTNDAGSKYVTKSINGKECPQFQSGTITKEDIDKGGETTRANRPMAKATRNMGLPGDDAGHMLANHLGGLMENSNLYPQSSTINRGIYRELEKMISKEICDKSAKVDYKMRLLYPGNSGNYPETRPFGTVLELNFRYGSRFVTKVYMIPNPINSRNCK